MNILNFGQKAKNLARNKHVKICAEDFCHVVTRLDISGTPPDCSKKLDSLVISLASKKCIMWYFRSYPKKNVTVTILYEAEFTEILSYFSER